MSGMKLQPAFSGITLNTGSGDVTLDRAAYGSIVASTRFPPLPAQFPGQTLGLRFYFYSNLKPTGIGISISPCADLRVPAGSTRQFPASGTGITEASVTWSVSGSGCSKSACGTFLIPGFTPLP